MTLTKDQMDKLPKLPKWAQDHIRHIERERETAIQALNQYIDSQSEAPFYTDDVLCTGEDTGPTFKRRYFQGHKITAEHAGLRLRILLSSQHDSQREHGIELSWEAIDKRAGTLVAMVPKSFHQVELVAKENMR